MDVVITDKGYEAPENPGPLDRVLLGLIRDKRDLPFLHLGMQILFLQLPLAIALFFADGFLDGWAFWGAAAAYLAFTFGVTVDRYILMLHCTSHRPLFKKQYQWMYPPFVWIMGPLNGETPETYYAHHIGMHHAEENLEGDLSTTMPFERDRLTHFLRYWGRFFFFGIFELSAYFAKKRNYKQMRKLLLGELSFYAVVAAGMAFAWRPTVIVLLVPFCVVRFLMMAGNWAQHSFIDPEDPKHPYKSSLTCINTRYNRRCYNDGYHIGHHEMAARHWSDLPKDFGKKLEGYGEKSAVVFEGIDFFQVWAILMLGRYDWLADRFVQLGDEKMSKEEIIDFLKSRTRPVVRELTPDAAPAE